VHGGRRKISHCSARGVVLTLSARPSRVASGTIRILSAPYSSCVCSLKIATKKCFSQGLGAILPKLLIIILPKPLIIFRKYRFPFISRSPFSSIHFEKVAWEEGMQTLRCGERGAPEDLACSWHQAAGAKKALKRCRRMGSRVVMRAQQAPPQSPRIPRGGATVQTCAPAAASTVARNCSGKRRIRRSQT
jgi:hypothetical protein